MINRARTIRERAKVKSRDKKIKALHKISDERYGVNQAVLSE